MKHIIKYVSTLLVILLSYQCETTVEPAELQPSFRIVHYDALPAAIRAEVTATENSLKSAYAYKNDTPFGALVAEQVHQRITPDGKTSYTMALRKNGDGFYYDNLVINEDVEGTIKTRVIRYQPDPEWYYQHKTEGLGYTSYSGDITIFNSAGEQLSSVHLIAGQPQKTVTETTASRAEGECEIVDIQEAGLLQDGVFYVYEITITVDCSGTGTGGSNDGLNDGFGNEGIEEGGGGSPGGGGGNTGPGEPVETVPVEAEDFVFDGPDTPISNISDYLECINPTQGATVTIYVDQPVADSNIVASGSDKAGHTFISISQNGNVSVFGFYPSGSATPFSPSDPSTMGDDSNHEYDVSISTHVDASTLQTVLSHSTSYPSSYNLNTYNCTDFVIEIGNILGMNLPDCYSSWGIGGGSNPAKLGQYIRENFNSNGTYLLNTSGGTSPSNNKGC